VCAKLGDQEVWELVNNTDELHNYHIHQTKFRLARSGDRGLPSGFTDKDAISDPANIVTSQVPEFGTITGLNGVDVWHDTLPVPPASFDSNGNRITPGRTLVTIPFKDPVQIGTFVFHCHILEHEDGGMMATVEVFDPAYPERSRQGADARPRFGIEQRAAFCRAPSVDAKPIIGALSSPVWDFFRR
jgi:FtsP/CotA-like multicopper oxidase with cupredoxin domain